ncbi:MAG: phosphoenolpyruvate--protein phosphotransferase [Treponemataceae bacterium]|nr:phosphoenolpyruvate--protein phosphotransferase [Treponemataceae bacterium]
MEVFLGNFATDSVGIGPAFVIPEQQKRIISQNTISIDEIPDERQRFENALEIVSNDISGQLANLPKTKENAIQREIFEAYLLMLDDPVFTDEVCNEFENERCNVEYALNVKTEEYADKLRLSGNAYLSARAKDILDIFGRVIDEMMGIHPFNINTVPDGSVIIASTLSPADTIILSKKKIAGLALAEGGISSHVMILARSYGIPAVVGLNFSDVKRRIQNGQTVIVDSGSRELLADPDEKTIREYKHTIRINLKEQSQFNSFLNKPAATADGEKFCLYANIGSIEEAEIAKNEGADGIGLFRTEFMFMSNGNISQKPTFHSFSEEGQFEVYKKVLEIMEGKPVTIRTLDAGGDKVVCSTNIPHLNEKNPLMGLRAIRLSLEYPEILKTQLRALYRASVYGNLKIMLPLITSVEQVDSCKKIIQDVKDELEAKNIPYSKKVSVGIMVETAAAAIISDCLAKKSDFFSIGTNDLTQYTLAVDRENAKIYSLYNESNLAVLRLISMTVKNAKNAKIPVSVCGEMASRRDTVPILAGMGIRSFSMSPKLINMIKSLLSHFTVPELQAFSLKSM